MTLSIFPAPSGTFVVNRERGPVSLTTRTPVIGFQYVQTGPVYPLCVMPFGGLTRGRALLHDSGFVSDPAAGIVCGSLEEWETLVDSPGYWAAAEDDSVETKLAEAGAELNGGPVGGDPGRAEPPVGRRIPDKPKRTRAPRKFLTKSYWMFEADGNTLARRIWLVAGSEIVPFEDDPDYKKITGEEFVRLKKEGWTIGDPRAEPKPEPLIERETAEDDGDDDDGSSLI